MKLESVQHPECQNLEKKYTTDPDYTCPTGIYTEMKFTPIFHKICMVLLLQKISNTEL